ncbi:L-iditol 2-dehydrogenase [Enterovibrio sp. ZSDZ42]|uniref:L-iditol 2-dehydrogenase n=1 Tax=Enterovibrio gelatinilyticus TaxID=2899819 RepID=A0ABT5R150_9GAMM|nr:L-iditol 2-dehydrogenase [Enterovibrio sp. ZSDZ42]MDD1794001.1 L-iditol 2-dehydrogenase [Enterovibrio sp. ZSDZ42]
MTLALEHDGRPLLQGKVALLTGANGGIGLAVTDAYLASGAKCVVADLPKDPSAGISALLDQYGDSLCYLHADITNAESRQLLVRTTLSQYGSIDVLFNNAAVFDMGPLLDATEAQFDRLFDVNVKAMFFLMQAVAKEMVQAGNGGKIINMASQAGRRGEALVAHYCATKAAVINYTQSAALALAEYGITVNGISPGVVDTPMWDSVDALFAKYEHRPLGEKKKQVGEDVPLKRMGVPNDIAGTALFLASPLSDYITAQTYNVDGGNVMS